MGKADPKSIGFAHSHPTTAERFVRMEQGIAEIEQKVVSKQPLQPNRRGTPKLTQPPERTFAGTRPGRDTAVARPGASNAAMLWDQVAQPVEAGASLVRLHGGEPTVEGYAPAPCAMPTPAAEGKPSMMCFDSTW
jgi:hypothetical protein